MNEPKTGIRKRFWVWVARLSVRHAFNRGCVPVGLPGNRDPENKCAHYWPVKQPSGHGPCESDGHYLCADCEWLTRGRLAEFRGGGDGEEILFEPHEQGRTAARITGGITHAPSV